MQKVLSLKYILYLVSFNLVLAFIMTGFFGLKEIMLWLNDATAYTLKTFIKTGLASSLLVTAILLLEQQGKVFLASCVTVKKVVLNVLLVSLSVLIVRYLPSWSIALIGNDNYWQMVYSGTLIYYSNTCYLIGVLVLLGITKLGIKFFASSEQTSGYQASLLVLCIGFSLWLIGLDLYHTNELLSKLAVALAIDLAIDKQSIFTVLYLGLVIFYMLIKIAVAVVYKERIKQQPHYLLTVGLIIWLLPLLMTETLSVLLNELGYSIVGLLFYSSELIITWLICYVCFKKNTNNSS